jgi:hypothetical protein
MLPKSFVYQQDWYVNQQESASAISRSRSGGESLETPQPSLRHRKKEGSHMHLLTLGTVKTLSVQNLINWSNLRHLVVIIGLALATFLLPTRAAFATPIPIDLGSTGVILGSHTVDLAAPNVQFQGQTIAMDFSFQNGQFIRLFTATKSFQIDTFFSINNAPLLPPLNFTGSGFLEDNQGGALGPTIALQASSVEDPDSQTGVDLLLRPVTSNAVPGDAYGFHLDLTLPNSPGFGFGDGGVTFDGNIFGIGPGDPSNPLPRDIVLPDFGSTGLLLTITLAGLVSMRVWVTPTR